MLSILVKAWSCIAMHIGFAGWRLVGYESEVPVAGFKTRRRVTMGFTRVGRVYLCLLGDVM